MAAGTWIQHVNLMVDDLARAIEFYGTALGLAPGNLIELSCESDQYVDPAIFDEAIFEPAFLDAT